MKIRYDFLLILKLLIDTQICKSFDNIVKDYLFGLVYPVPLEKSGTIIIADERDLLTRNKYQIIKPLSKTQVRKLPSPSLLWNASSCRLKVDCAAPFGGAQHVEPT